MPRVVPSQVVDLIDKLFPWAKDQREADTKNSISADNSYSVAAVLELTEALPSELLVLNTEDYAEFAASVASLRTLLRRWETRDYQFHRISGLRYLSPITLLRQSLAKCPDEFPARSTRELPFIADEALRDILRLDISMVNSALVNGEWKAATVLAGSVVEALLLWALDRKPGNEVADAIASTGKTFKSDRRKWNLGEYIEVCKILKIIEPNTVAQCEIGRGFRNLIHPGKEQRKGQVCNRGTALSAVAAIEHVVTDLSNATWPT